MIVVFVGEIMYDDGRMCFRECKIDRTYCSLDSYLLNMLPSYAGVGLITYGYKVGIIEGIYVIDLSFKGEKDSLYIVYERTVRVLLRSKMLNILLD